MNRGFIITAQNNDHTDYVFCAKQLCRNIKQKMPGASVTLLTDKMVDEPVFNHVVVFPHGDQCVGQDWKLANDWQVYDASPYEYTIKLEADLYLPRSIDHWWNTLSKHDLVLMTTIRNYTNEISHEKFYRRFITENNLPDTYNAITYFRKSTTAQLFYSVVGNIFENWNDYLKILRPVDTFTPSTDFVYAIAAHIMGVENCTLPNFTDFSMTHMKPMINSLVTHNWCEQLIYEITPESMRINTIPQMYPVHYHVKKFAYEL
jgi:hypothetical protein